MKVYSIVKENILYSRYLCCTLVRPSIYSYYLFPCIRLTRSQLTTAVKDQLHGYFEKILYHEKDCNISWYGENLRVKAYKADSCENEPERMSVR